MQSPPAIGQLIRHWRNRRRLSQLDLAYTAGLSQRHLSFVEQGRARPSREMVLRIAEGLEVPLRERNDLLLAAGFAPVFSHHPLDAPDLEAARAAVQAVLAGHEPFPAIAVDRHWNLVLANAAVAPLFAAVADPGLLEPPVNVLRLSLHPAGLAPAIRNYPAWRSHLLARLRRQLVASPDEFLAALYEELAAYPAPHGTAFTAEPISDWHGGAIAVPLELELGDGVLSLLGTITVFGTPVDITLAELAIESFFPADAETAARLRALQPVEPVTGAAPGGENGRG